MNGRVIFFPLKFNQSQEKLDELLKAQEILRYARISFLNAVKRESPWQQTLAHARLKNMIRERLKVLEGSCEVEQTEDSLCP